MVDKSVAAKNQITPESEATGMGSEQEGSRAGSRLRVRGLPDQWQQYGLCLLFHLLLPFLPLVIEWIVLGHMEEKTFFLFLSVFPLSIGVTSRSALLFGVTIVIGLLYSIFFGLIAGSLHLNPMTTTWGYFCLFAVILIHSMERYNRHVADLEPFWEFSQG